MYWVNMTSAWYTQQAGEADVPPLRLIDGPYLANVQSAAFQLTTLFTLACTPTRRVE